MREAVICEPLRTPIGRYGGVFRDLSAVDLGVTALTSLLKRTGIPGDAVDDVIIGNCSPNAEAPAIGRVIALTSGLPFDVPGQQVDRRCGSGMQAVLNAVMTVESGAADLVIAGGAESMSNAAYYTLDARWGAGRTGMTMHDTLARARVTAGGPLHPVAGGMVETAENVRRRFEIPRAEQDELALTSHQRAVMAQESGVFDDEIVPTTVRRGSEVKVVDADEHPRPETTLESLAALRPLMIREVDDATVTAGNSSGQNDAAALCVVASRSRADELGLRPLSRVVSWALAGVDPRLMGVGPVPATARALARAGLRLADMELIELNEAFAAQAIAVLRTWNFAAGDLERVNVHGSGISLGHPVGATGARLVGTLARELHRRSARYGLATMCIGGGQGIATVLERVDP